MNKNDIFSQQRITLRWNIIAYRFFSIATEECRTSKNLSGFIFIDLITSETHSFMVLSGTTMSVMGTAAV